MTTIQQVSDTEQRTEGMDVLRILLGLALILPALLACLAGLVAPTVNTLITGMQNTSLIGPAQFVGLANYVRLFADKVFARAWGFTLQVAVVRVLAAGIVPPLLALAVAPFGRRVRLPLRLLFTVPLAMFAPVSLALVWLAALNPTSGFLRGTGLALSDPVRAGWTFLLVDALATFGIACGIGLIVFLAARQESLSRDLARIKTLLAVWGIGALAAAALALQSFTLNYALTGGGPLNVTMTLALYQYNLAFRNLRFGYGAAAATITLAVLMLLGLIASLIVLFTGLRVEFALSKNAGRAEAGAGEPVQRAPLAIPLLVVLLPISLALCTFGALPSAWNLLNALPAAFGELAQRVPVGRVLVNTLVPPMMALLAQLPLAYLAALGIGALRPLGKWSEALLVPFGLWLFVGVEPLSIAAYQTARGASLLNTLIGLTPPMMLSVPMLFVFTLFFKGQEPRWRAAREADPSGVRAFFTQLVLPSLPLVALLACVALLISTQDLLWPLLIAAKPEYRTASVTLLQLFGMFSAKWQLIAACITLFGLPAFMFYFGVLGALQIFYLDRLTLRTGAG